MVPSLRLCFARPVGRGGVFVKILDPVFVNEQVWLGAAGDPDDILIVIFDPTSHFFAIDQFHDNGRSVLGKSIDVFGFAESRFRRGLAAISPAGVFIWGSYCHAPKYSVFDVKIQE